VIRRFGGILAEYQRETGDSILVSWIGGEPCLFPPLNSLTTFFTKELGLRVSATTNGTTLVNDSMRKHVLDHYAELTVSVDGIGCAHDNLRGWPGGYTALRKAVMQLVEAKRTHGRGPRLRANVVLMRQTLGDFEKLCLELATWGIDEITFNQLGGQDRPDFFPAHRLLPEQAGLLAQQIAAIRAQLCELGVVLKGSSDYVARIQASSRDETIPIMDCKPGEQFLFISEEGMASPCSFTVQDYGVSVMELTDVAALRGLPARFARARSRRTSSPCEDCHSTRVFDKFAA
jgi:MoaA/NifB/PqqE/SkfB family radical SAM enzyme